MYYIYCYTNKINNHKYVGQTNNLKRRIREHSSAAFNPNASSYNDLIHKKIREYGEDNFQIDILEKGYTNDINIINEKEQYWVKKMNSYCGNGQGYNLDHGGCNKNHSKKLIDGQITEIKNKLKQGISFIDIEKEYNISSSFISSINHGTYFYDDRESYPLSKYYKEDKDYDELIDLLLNSSLTLSDIAKQLNISYATVKKINAGTLRNGLYPDYPIRKITANEQRANKIKDLLLTTTYTNKEIAKIVNSSEETVRRINVGQTFKDNNLSYPLRNL